MIRMMIAAALFALAACGADSAPERPEPKPQPGITVSGIVEVGISSRG